MLGKFNKSYVYFRALLAYHASYEGNPITDDIVLETQQILEDINTLEAESITDELLTMSMQPQHKKCQLCNCKSENNIQISGLSLTSKNHAIDSMDTDDSNMISKIQNRSLQCSCNIPMMDESPQLEGKKEKRNYLKVY